MWESIRRSGGHFMLIGSNDNQVTRNASNQFTYFPTIESTWQISDASRRTPVNALANFDLFNIYITSNNMTGVSTIFFNINSAHVGTQFVLIPPATTGQFRNNNIVDTVQPADLIGLEIDTSASSAGNTMAPRGCNMRGFMV